MSATNLRSKPIAKASNGDSKPVVPLSTDLTKAAKSTRRDTLIGFAGVAFATVQTNKAFAEDSMADGSPSSATSESIAAETFTFTPPEPVPQKPVPPVRYKGTNWSVICPGDYERKATEKPRRIYEQRTDNCEPNCRDLQAKRTEETPLVARFGSVDDQQDIAVSIRGANTLKLTFLQIKDVTEFGEVTEAAPLFIPPEAKLISASARTSLAGTPSGDNINKGYYTYDFEFGNARVLLTASVESGNVYLLGCTSSSDKWNDSSAGFKRAAASFRVGSEPKVVEVPSAITSDSSDAKDVNLSNKNNKPAETMNCKGPLPIFCSVEAD